MYRRARHPLLKYVPRRNFFRVLRLTCFWTCCLCFLFQYFIVKLITDEEEPVAEGTRLHPDRPLTINLRPFPVCRPQELYLDNLIIQYHNRYPDKDKQVCFLVENLDGGPWWSYVTHEFAEILTRLKQFGVDANITYRSFPDHPKLTRRTNLTKYFLKACSINEHHPVERERPIIVLLWDINQVPWQRMRQQWEHLLTNTRTRVVAFIDDLHFTSSEIFASRQYLFQSVASEILSTYAYLFHDYYTNISSEKVTWVPHAASTLTTRMINETAENRLFVSGANMYAWYPCRAHAFNVCHKRKDLASCLRHPGYGPNMRNGTAYHYGGERYFSYMKQYVFGLGTCQSVHYAIAKLFEIPANGLALITTDDLVPILEHLHLKHDEHFLTVNCSSPTILQNEIVRLQHFSKDKILQMRKASQAVIYERHLTKHRAELIHVRLLVQSLLVSSVSIEGNIQWEQWGRNCN